MMVSVTTCALGVEGWIAEMKRRAWNALRARYRRELRENPELREFRRGWLRVIGYKGE